MPERVPRHGQPGRIGERARRFACLLRAPRRGPRLIAGTDVDGYGSGRSEPN